MISAKRLKDLVIYDPATGVFTARITRGNVAKGNVRGSPMPAGYWSMRLDGGNYYNHRLAWLYMTDEWPHGEIDHIDCDRANNRWSNLRIATRAQNAGNFARRAKGAYWHPKNRNWYSRIKVAGRSINLGSFSTREAAEMAYATAARSVFGEFTHRSISDVGHGCSGVNHASH